MLDALVNGERQVAPDLSGIRRDHVERYRFAARAFAPGSRIIDLACGCGYGSAILADHGHEVLAVDRSADALDYAREHYARAGIAYLQCDADRFVVPDGVRFDAAVCFETIEHLADPRALLRTLAGAAERLIASVPNEAQFPFRSAANGFRGYAHHHRHYTRRDLRQLLAQCGWGVTNWHGQIGPTSDVEPEIDGRTIIADARAGRYRGGAIGQARPALAGRVRPFLSWPNPLILGGGARRYDGVFIGECSRCQLRREECPFTEARRPRSPLPESKTMTLPTETMVMAGARAACKYIEAHSADTLAEVVFHAMCAAAPEDDQKGREANAGDIAEAIATCNTAELAMFARRVVSTYPTDVLVDDAVVMALKVVAGRLLAEERRDHETPPIECGFPQAIRQRLTATCVERMVPERDHSSAHGTVPDHVAIVGLGPSCREFFELMRHLGGASAYCDEVWGINALGDVLKCDRIFHMDDLRIQEARAAARPGSNIAAMVDWLRTHPGPIYTSVPHPGYPGLVAFPLEAVLNGGYDGDGGAPYFNSTAAYAIAFAVHVGVKKISLFGLDYTMPNAHLGERGRACCEFWLGIAAARGIAIQVPETSALLDACAPERERLYGYDCVDVHLAERPDGSLSVSFGERTDIPSAEEIERRYDHSRHPNRMMQHEEATR